MKPENHDDRDQDPQLTQRSRELFDDAVANLDGHTRSRLNQARQAALQAAQGATSVTHRWLLPVGSAAVLALATVATLHGVHTERPVDDAMISVEHAAAVDDLEIVTADADLDLLKDMDFYAWLDTQDMTAVSTESEDG